MRLRRLLAAAAVAGLALPGVVGVETASAEEVFAGTCSMIVDVDTQPTALTVQSAQPGNCAVSHEDKLHPATLTISALGGSWLPGVPFTCWGGVADGGASAVLDLPTLGRQIELGQIFFRAHYAAGVMDAALVLDTAFDHFAASGNFAQLPPPAEVCLSGANPTRWIGDVAFEVQIPDGPIGP